MSVTVLFSLVLLSAPSEIEHDFNSAREHALAQNYQQAEALYRSLISRGYQTGDIFYNLGHVLDSAGKPIQAIIWYERALAQNPSDEDAHFNLLQLRAQLPKGGSESAPAAISFAEAVNPIVGGPRLVSIIGWLSACILLFTCIFQCIPSIRFRLGILNALAGVSLIGLLWVAIAAASYTEALGVITKSVPLREGPDDRFDAATQLIPGERVRILSRSAQFREVQRTDGTIGFVTSSALEPLNL